jgi:hypothetical protein
LGAERQAPKITQKKAAFVGFLRVFGRHSVWRVAVPLRLRLSSCGYAQKKHFI